MEGMDQYVRVRSIQSSPLAAAHPPRNAGISLATETRFRGDVDKTPAFLE